MSYSFTICTTGKAEAKLAVAAKFDEAVAHQSCHQRDREQALAAAGAFIDLLDDREDSDLTVAMNGYLAGIWKGTDVTSITGASVSVSAGWTPRG